MKPYYLSKLSNALLFKIHDNYIINELSLSFQAKQTSDVYLITLIPKNK